MSGQRQIRRSIQKNRTGIAGGICPKCKGEPLGTFAECEPSSIAICPFCKWYSPKLTRWLVMGTHHPEAAPSEGSVEAFGIVRSDRDPNNAIRRAFRQGILTATMHGLAVEIDRNAPVGADYYDRPLTSDELDDLTAAMELKQAFQRGEPTVAPEPDQSDEQPA